MRARLAPGGRQVRDGVTLLFGMLAAMWALAAIDYVEPAVRSGGTSVHDRLAMDGGILPRNVGHLWAIFTAPFLHENFYPHLIDNTIPLAFMGVIIAVHGARRLGLVTLIVIVVSGLGTWLIAPGNTDTFGASGLVFGYATYLFARGLFNRNVLEVVVGLFVGLFWGAALVASIVPHAGVSWQDHVCGAIGGVIAAWLLAAPRGRAHRDPSSGGTPASGGSHAPGGHELHSALDRAISS
jgi:membrane associated rhomboid family serine protease